MLEFLCNNLKKSLSFLDHNLIYEIRVRVGQPTRINYGGKYEYLGLRGLAKSKEGAVVCSEKEIEEMIYSAAERSIYAVEEQIKRGFISAKNGVRIGMAGEYVFSNGQPHTIRNVSSLCIRVPHKILGCSKEIYNICYKNDIKNLLILSAPGYGKTTILKDLITQISHNTLKNILICDERGELSDYEMGPTCDKIAYADKSTAFEAGIRSMRPDVIVTDEVTTEELNAINKIIFSGVNVIATAHLDSFDSVCKNNMNIFDYYAILNRETIGKLDQVCNVNGDILYKNVN